MSTGDVVSGGDGGLSPEEQAVWFSWKLAHEVVRAQVRDEVTRATGLSEADVEVLMQLSGADYGLQQSSLTTRLGWDRTRLWHHLARMEKRGLLQRSRGSGSVTVRLTEDGRRALEELQPVHASAVRRHLFEPTDADLGLLRMVLEPLTGAKDRQKTDATGA